MQIKPLLTIGMSTLLISGSSYLFLHLYQKKVREQKTSPKFAITHIIQTGPSKKALPTDTLAKFMDLSIDQPTNLYRFPLKAAEIKLCDHPLIESAKIKRIKPNSLFIDYALRAPLARIGDYSNTAVDQNGVLFPLEPYLTPKNLPEIVFGMSFDEPIWGKKVDLDLALDLFEFVSQFEELDLKRIDFTDLKAESYGKRGITLILSHGSRDRILRLSHKEHRKELSRYMQLQRALGDESADNLKPAQVIDLRIEDLAFITN